MAVPVPTPTAAACAGRYAAATAALRAEIRRLIGAAAAVGAVLVAGLQLTAVAALGRHDLLRLGVALLGLGTVLCGVVHVILSAFRVLTDEWVTLADLHMEMFDQLLRGEPKTRRERYRRRIFDDLFAQLELV